MQGTTQDASRLACSGRAWHSARIAVVAVGKAKGWLAGRQASCWRGDAVRIAGMSMSKACFGDGLSERSSGLDPIAEHGSAVPPGIHRRGGTSVRP